MTLTTGPLPRLTELDVDQIVHRVEPPEASEVRALAEDWRRLGAENAGLRAEAERVRSLLPYPSVLDEAGFIVRRAGYGPMADSLQTWGACIRGFYEREARGE